jgi:hypothetical protein
MGKFTGIAFSKLFGLGKSGPNQLWPYEPAETVSAPQDTLRFLHSALRPSPAGYSIPLDSSIDLALAATIEKSAHILAPDVTRAETSSNAAVITR